MALKNYTLKDTENDIQNNPYAAKAYTRLGINLDEQGRKEEAIEKYKLSYRN